MGWILKFVTKLPAAIALLADALEDARRDDGVVSPDEAEALARSLAVTENWLDVRVRGVDIIGPDATADLFAGIARIIARAENIRSGHQ
jgi:hypothetical protein